MLGAARTLHETPDVTRLSPAKENIGPSQIYFPSLGALKIQAAIVVTEDSQNILARPLG